MSCSCTSCKASDEELSRKLVALGYWLVNREGKNGATTASMLRRKLIKIGIIDEDNNKRY
jgi:hypothetical protein